MRVPGYIRKLAGATFVLASITASCALVNAEHFGGAKITPPDPHITSQVSAATDDFGFRLLNELATNPKENTIISPFGIATAFAMAYNGAAGATKAEMAKTLGLGSLGDEDLNQANRYLMQTLEEADPAVETEIANAIWVQKDYQLNPDFSRVCESFYDARAARLDFVGDPTGAAAEINSWVDKNTHHRIPVLVSNIERNTRLILTDAVYFKGVWSSKFKKEQTRPRPFHLLNGDSHDAAMMDQSGEFSYLENDNFQAIRLPYGSKRYAMYVFLPRKMAGLPDFLRSLNGAQWMEWTNGLRSRSGEVVLPRFETTYGKKLNDTLKKMGMQLAFDNKADFSRIPLNANPRNALHINDVEHKTWVKVDEEGSEAAAATSIGMVVAAEAGIGIGPFLMVVDHPFFFAITELQTGALLFAGVVMDPTMKDDA
jgi:serine protease inhibitor